MNYFPAATLNNVAVRPPLNFNLKILCYRHFKKIKIKEICSMGSRQCSRNFRVEVNKAKRFGSKYWAIQEPNGLMNRAKLRSHFKLINEMDI